MGNLGLAHVALWCALVACALLDNKVCCASYNVKISETLRTLLSPRDSDSLQVQALRRQLFHKLQDMTAAEQENEKIYRCYMPSPTRWNEFMDEHKRNLESLARGGIWYKNPPLADDNKRSTYNTLLGTHHTPPISELPVNQKRNVEALARNGELNYYRNYEDLPSSLDELNENRNVASLTNHFSYPIEAIGKRSISSVAKNGDLPNVYGKRNIQSLARDGLLGKKFREFVEAPQNKRIQSIKTEQRRKRQADYFSNEAVYQMPVDYENVLQDLEAAGLNYPLDKRFLGSVAKSGWFEPSSRNYKYLPTKRHVAALARLGWLPTYRSSRRFNRSGRSYLRENDTEDTCRKTSTDGKAQNYSYTKVSSVPLDSKRFLLQPAVDNILLRKVFRHPRMIF